ncbi:MAG: PilT/PilU family type 4a pilus ATPase [Acidobacteria bacterium]|nr:PilT/PilU family type 4a pilus ATPase [Acidobacteriota bacterium]
MDVQLLNQLLTAGVKHGASDIHFFVGVPPCYRMKGTLVPIKGKSLDPLDTQKVAELILRNDNRVHIEEIHEYDTSYSIPNLSRFRVNIFRQRGSFGIVLRIIPPEIPTIDSLNLPEVIRKVTFEERGMVLVTGVTGSGKSSTLAAMVNEINRTRNGKHILTIEDPIEYLHSHQKSYISQREVERDTGGFAAALRAALRQDPDIILVGEMRDHDTVDTAIKAAETGHLVFSTAHTTDAAKTIGRIVSVFPPQAQLATRFRLAEALVATISQRLLPRSDATGRVPAVEIMIVTPRVREYIVDAEKTAGLKDVIAEGHVQYGMQTFDMHLSRLYKDNLISLEVARSAATSPADFERALSFD